MTKKLALIGGFLLPMHSTEFATDAKHVTSIIMVDQGPQRKRGKNKTWTLDPNIPIPKTTKWRLSSRQSTTSTDEEFISLFNHEMNRSINDTGGCDESVNISLNIDHEAPIEAEDGADSLPLPTAALETDINGIQVFVNREVESDVEQLSSEEESSFESGSESELEEVETEDDFCRKTCDLNEDDNVLLYQNAEVSKLAAHVMVNLFIMEHKLSHQATEDLIQMINFLLPGGHRFVRSAYLLKKYFVNLFEEPLPKRHKYCGRCLDSIPSSTGICSNEQCQIVHSPVKEFLEIDLSNQLTRLFKGEHRNNISIIP